MKPLGLLARLFRFFRVGKGNAPARSGEPVRIHCADLDAVPPADELARLAVAGRHVVLQFPPSLGEGKRQVIERLAPLLRGHSVFDSGPGRDGTECVTVHKVIDEEVVLVNLLLFLRAIRDFSDTARDLCYRLAAAHAINPADLLARRADIRGGEGRLGGWGFFFHGLECCFTGCWSGQVVDVRLGFGDEFGVLDPYFLAQFIRTTPAHREAAGLLQDDYHDPCRMLAVLKARGFLRVVVMPCAELGGQIRGGLALDPAEASPPGA
jgi:hypothetical protein